MVNDGDYNTFMLQDPTILKMRAINRTFAGDSKYMAWHDGSDSYENVKLFGDDLCIYFKDGDSTQDVVGEARINALITNHIEPILPTTDIFTILTSRGMEPAQIRRTFSEDEKSAIDTALTDAALNPATTVPLYIGYNSDINVYEWIPGTSPDGIIFEPPVAGYDNYLLLIIVEAKTTTSWSITHKTERMVAESQATKFWNSNDANNILDYDTLNTVRDNIVILNANKDKSRLTTLSENKLFDVIGHETIELGLPNAGLAVPLLSNSKTARAW